MTIDVSTNGFVATVTINRPDARNALDPSHNESLTGEIRALDASDEIRAIVLTGAGDVSFCAGVDLKTFLPPVRDAIRKGHNPPWVLGGITQYDLDRTPIIAAVNGHALAGGLELALACDIRIASPNATFGLAETRWGIIPGAGGTQRLPRTIPIGPALEMLITGDPISVADAERWGLVNRVIPQSDLLETAQDLAAIISARGPLAVRAARRTALQGLSIGLEAGLRAEYQTFLEIMRTDDAVEGSTAFAEKRPPLYTGR